MNISDLLDPEKMEDIDSKFRYQSKDFTREGKLRMKLEKEKDNALELNNLEHNIVTEDFSDSPHI